MIGYKQEKVFDPASVEFRNDIKSKGVANTPMLYDVDNNRMIVVDLEATIQNPFIHAKNNSKSLFQPYPDTLTVENLCGAAAQACYGIVNMEKPNMYELAMYNVRARHGEITDNIEEADTIFAVSKDQLPETKEGAEVITIYDKDIITSNLMMSDPEKEEIIEEIEK